MIRRTASEILHDLEMRVARLEERTAASRGPAIAYFYGDNFVLQQLEAFAKADIVRMGLPEVAAKKFHVWFPNEFRGNVLAYQTPYGRKGVSDDMPYLLDNGGFEWDWKNRSKGTFFVYAKK